jgi:hypothetical protein
MELGSAYIGPRWGLWETLELEVKEICEELILWALS